MPSPIQKILGSTTPGLTRTRDRARLLDHRLRKRQLAQMNEASLDSGGLLVRLDTRWLLDILVILWNGWLLAMGRTEETERDAKPDAPALLCFA